MTTLSIITIYLIISIIVYLLTFPLIKYRKQIHPKAIEVSINQQFSLAMFWPILIPLAFIFAILIFTGYLNEKKLNKELYDEDDNEKKDK